LRGIAPRLYDVIELVDQHGNRWAAYVVQHVSGREPVEADYEAMLRKLHALEDEGLIRLVTPGGWNGTGFRKFDCNGNLLVLPTGEQRYIDVHSFVLDQYERHLSQVADEASTASHFGGKSVILGGKSGRYLYQEIPGVP